MADEFVPSVAEEVNPGPTLEEQGVEMGIAEDGTPLTTEEYAEQGLEEQSLILGKFQDQQALESAYTSLEQHLSQSNPDNSAALTQASEFYASNGYLDDANYQSLGTIGLSKQLVDQYIAGSVAQATQLESGYYERTNGQAGYQQMSDWMTMYLPDGEINAYNRVLDSGSNEEVGVLISGMYARYAQSMGNYTQLQGGQATNESAGFQSRGQVMAAMGDPRYETDSAYRQEVEDKLAVTSDAVF